MDDQHIEPFEHEFYSIDPWRVLWPLHSYQDTTLLSFERDLWNLKWRENPKNGKPSNLEQKHFSGVLDEPAERFGDHDVPPRAGQLVGRVPLDSGGCTVAVPSFLFLLLLTIIQIIDWFVREKRIGSQ